MATDTSAAPTQQAQVSQERTADTPTELPSVTDNNKSSNSQKLDRPAHDNPPSAKDLQKVENYQVRDSKGNSHTFKSLYDGPESPDRVLVIFIRHFFCGACQEFIRALSQSVKADDLRRLPNNTSIVVIGCGDPGLIEHYISETGCGFSIYSDPSRKLYNDLGMAMSLAIGSRPQYFRKSMFSLTAGSIVQGLKHMSSGLATKAGDSRQNGGEFLFERGTGSGDSGKEVTWCHRMANTRDHTDIPELVKVLDPEGSVLQRNA